MSRLHDGYNKDGDLWNGPGLVSSAARANPEMAIGAVSGEYYHVLHPGALFDGQVVADTDVLLMYTLAGDASLDGKLTMDDYALLDADRSCFRTCLTLPGLMAISIMTGVIDYQDVMPFWTRPSHWANGLQAQAMIAKHANKNSECLI